MKRHDINSVEWHVGKLLMMDEIKGLSQQHPVRELLVMAFWDYERGLWSYDGATFVQERFKTHKWEVAAFIHDWRNSMGYVGSKVDQEFFSIMTTLKYPAKIVSVRWFLCRLTFMNVLRHRIKRTFKSSKDVKFYKLDYEEVN